MTYTWRELQTERGHLDEVAAMQTRSAVARQLARETGLSNEQAESEGAVGSMAGQQPPKHTKRTNRPSEARGSVSPGDEGVVSLEAPEEEEAHNERAELGPENEDQGVHIGPNEQSTDYTKFWREIQERDKDLMILKQWILDGKPSRRMARQHGPALRSYYNTIEQMKIKDGVLYRVWSQPDKGQDKDLILIPQSLSQNFLRLSHDLLSHVGIAKCVANLRSHYYWFGMTSEVTRWINSCVACQMKRKSKYKAPLQVDFASYPLESVSIDIKTLSIPSSSGNVGFLTVVDRYSRFVQFLPLKNYTALEIFSQFYRHWVSVLGIPSHIFSDNGPNLTQTVAQDVCRMLSINRGTTVVYFPQQNGLCESRHMILSSLCKTMLMKDFQLPFDKLEWDYLVYPAAFAINHTVNAQTNFCPAQLMFSKEHIKTPVTLAYPVKDSEVPQSVRQLRHVQMKMLEMVRQHEGTERARTSRYYSLREKFHSYQKGDKVLRLRFAETTPYPSSFRSQFLDEIYTIEKKLSDVYYTIKGPDGQLRVQHHDQLRPFQEEEVLRRPQRETRAPTRLNDYLT